MLAGLLACAAVPHAWAAELSTQEAEKLVMDAIALYRSGDSKAALANLDRALVYYKGAGDRESEATVLYAQGTVLAASGQHAKALEAFAATLVIERERNDDAGMVDTLRQQGSSQIKLGQYEPAVQSYEQERAINVKLGDRKAEAESLRTLGLLYGIKLNRREDGLAMLRQSLAIRREVDDRAGEAGDLSDQAVLLSMLEQREQAIAAYEESLKIWQSLGDGTKAEDIRTKLAQLRAAATPREPRTAKQRAQAEQANDMNDECVRLMGLGRYDKAQSKCQRAAELARLADDRDGESMALGNLAALFFTTNDYTKAMETARRSLTLAREIGNVEGQVGPLTQMGLVYVAWAQYPQALTTFQSVLTIQRKFYDGPGERRTLGNLAGLYVLLHQYDQAIAIWQAERFGNAQTLLNLGTVYALKKDLPQARDSFQKALELQRRSGDPLVSTTLGNLGSVHAELGEYDKARLLLDEALSLHRTAGDRMSEGGTLGQIAYVQSRTGKLDEALASYQQALALAREISVPTAQSSSLAGVGRVLEQQGKSAEALDAYMQAIAIEEDIRAAGQADEIKIGLGERSIELYQRAVGLLVRSGKHAEAFELAERGRARTFLDQLGSTRVEAKSGSAGDEAARERELRLAWLSLEHLLQQERTRPRAAQDPQRIRSLSDRLKGKREEYAQELLRLKSSNPEYASLVSVAPPNLAELQSLLGANTTLVSYFVTPTETLAFVLTSSSVQTVSIPVSEGQLTATVAELRAFDSIGTEMPPSLARLSDWLVTPVQPLLKTQLVGIVPHGVLHLLPFAALRTAEGYLADKYTLFHLPSASALPFIRQKRKAVQGDVVVLAHGRAEGLPPLQHAEQEATAIASLYGATPILGGKATEGALRSAAAKAGIIHIAAHGQLNAASPLFSRIVLAPDDALDASLDGSLEVREIYALGLDKASLVVLSACETQLGARSAGDDVVGLTRAFIYAGAPTVVASLWSVDDVATADLMTAFYKNIRQGQGKAAALRAAQAEIRIKRPHPYYWAAFVLTGDPN
jgi:CHAT domain-containing protein